MNLPAELATEFQTHTGSSPVLVLRALYGLGGALGETHLAANGAMLALFSKPLGSSAESHFLPLANISTLAIEPDSIYTICRIQSDTEHFVMKFTSWDRPKLDELTRLWRESNPKAGSTPVAGPPVAVAPIQTEPITPAPRDADETAIEPLVGFCAAMHALAASDGQTDPAELALLSRLIHEPAHIRRGAEYLRATGLENLPKALNSILSIAQKRCLIANMISLAMLDGVLRSSELTMLEQFRTGLNFDMGDYSTIHDVLMLKNNVAIFAGNEEEETSWRDQETLTPLVALCASMYAMLQVDEQAHELEWQAFNNAVHDTEAVERGVRHFQTYGVDFLLTVLSDLLNREQSRCLYANLLRVAMADEMLRTAERELLLRFQMALGISEQEHEAIYAVLLVKLDLSVF